MTKKRASCVSLDAIHSSRTLSYFENLLSKLINMPDWARKKLKNLANFPKGESALYFEKIYIYVYKVSYCDKGKMKDSKNFDVA